MHQSSLSERQLEAFNKLEELKQFSKAAVSLHITQSALSQRISALEKRLGKKLVIREAAGIQLSMAGKRLLSYCKLKNILESELFQDLQVGETPVVSFRIAAHSSVLRSVCSPIINSLLVSNPLLNMKVLSSPSGEVANLLKNGHAEWVLSREKIAVEGIESLLIGKEHHFMLESINSPKESGVYVSEIAEHSHTDNFLREQLVGADDMKKVLYADIYNVRDAVCQSIGRALIPMHLVAEHHQLVKVDEFEPFETPIYLAYSATASASKIFQTTIAQFQLGAARYLSRDSGNLMPSSIHVVNDRALAACSP